MIPCFIPSKNRSAQLDLLLRSLDKNAHGLFDPYVVYTSTNDDFAEGYRKLRYNGTGDLAKFHEEDDSEKNFYDFLELHAEKNELIALFSDDSIFYRASPICEGEIIDTLQSVEVFSFTFRLGKNITIKDYVINQPAKQPDKFYEIEESDNIILWEYTKIDFWDMFGFSVGFDGYIYRAKDLLELSEKKPFGKICYWEHMICEQFQQKGSKHKLMASPLQSNVFVEQINITHNIFHRTNNTFHMSLEELNKNYLDGRVLDLDQMDFEKNIPTCTHGEREVFWK